MPFRLTTLTLLLALLASSTQADTLADIYELALKNDAKLQAAEASFKANKELKRVGRSALLPQLSAGGEYGENKNTVRTSTKRDSRFDRSSASVNLSQTLFDLSQWFSFRSGKFSSKQAEAQFAFDQQDMIVRVADAYFNVLRAMDNLEASRAEERATQRQLEQTQQRFDVGLIAITDVHEAQAVFDSTLVRRLTDEGNLGTALESLTVLTGRSHNNLWLLNQDYPVISPEPQARDAWVDFALENNALLKAAGFAMEAAKNTARARKMEHLPKITGSATYNYFDQKGNDASSRSSIESETDGYSWAVRLSVPLYSGGGISANRRRAHQQYNAARQNQIDIQRTVVRNTRAAHITVATDVQRVKARKQAIISNSSALDATQAGYEVGTRNIVDVLQAQRSLYSAIRDYANTRYNYVLNLLRLKQSAGTLTPSDIYVINSWLTAPDAPTASQYQEYFER